MKQDRKIFIDILRFFAVLLITNSHMKELYPEPFTPLATGGAIGDALFFFCSGYALMFSKNENFFNWYKKRICRIYPAIFAMASIHIMIGQKVELDDVILRGGGWFIQCIFVFYFIFWFVKRYFSKYIPYVMLADLALILVWYCFWDKNVPILYDGTYLRWPVYFLVMLFGAFLQTKSDSVDSGNKTIIRDIALLFISLFCYYGWVGMGMKFDFFARYQIVSVVFLLALIYLCFRICCSEQMNRFYSKKIAHNIIYWISMMCLEVYICQTDVMHIGIKTIKFFPLNVILTFVVIFVFAYMVKIIGNFLTQTFGTEEYNWKKMITL